MRDQYPIYTEKTECQDCYKCIRNCPVKAIKIEDNSAVVMRDHCIYCGKCVRICPGGSKKIRNDLGYARRLVRENPNVIASLAPSYVTEFSGEERVKLVGALKKLGFAGVSETALGAQIVSYECRKYITGKETGLFISSACPVANNLIRKYYPQYTQNILPMISPVIAHAKFLREKADYEDSPIVFINPCIAKKDEVAEYPGLVDVSITFGDLRRWLSEQKIDLMACEQTPFVPYPARDGSLYPTDGGMIRGIKNLNSGPDTNVYLSFTGIQNITDALADIHEAGHTRKIFVELLACEGGCINGPCASVQGKTALKEITIREVTDMQVEDEAAKSTINIEERIIPAPVSTASYNDTEIKEALARLNKLTESDELNCGGCGYNSCRDFARALLDKNAETTMCASYMRKLATNKANALIKMMPSGVVIVDNNLNVIESNYNFARILGEQVCFIYDIKPGLKDADLRKLIPFHELFTRLLSDDSLDVINRRVRYNRKILQVTVFPIEKGHIVGAVIRDITRSSLDKEEIITKARKVIKKNIKTVQKIAFLLGENASESEIILNSIIDSFSAKPIKEKHHDR